MANKNILWIVIGVAAALIVIYLAATVDLKSGVSGNGETAENGGISGEALLPGTSLVSEGGQVISANGQIAENDAEWGTPSAPQQSGPVAIGDLPRGAVSLNVIAGGFSPGSFKVKAGEVVVLSLTSKDSFTHSFHFSDQSLQAVALGVGPGETRAITFNAPKQKGQYEFFCDLPGHRDRGETGVMVVE